MNIWIEQGLSLKDRAYRAWEIRHSARLQARQMMPDPVEVERLRRRDLEKYDNPDGPTFDQLVQQWKNKGLSGDEVYEAIIGSSQRTDRDVNKRFNLE